MAAGAAVGAVREAAGADAVGAGDAENWFAELLSKVKP